MPTNTDTQSASTLTHDLGSDEHRWRYAYVQGVDFATNTTTATLLFQGISDTITGGLAMTIEGVEIARFTPSGLRFPGSTTTTHVYQSVITGQTGGMQFLQNGQTLLKFDTTGVYQTYLKVRPVTLDGSNAGAAGLVFGPVFNTGNILTATAFDIAGSSLTVATDGRPIIIGFMGDTAAGGYIRFRATVTADQPAQGTIMIMRNGTQIANVDVMNSSRATSTGETYSQQGAGILAIDPVATTGANAYYLRVNGGSNDSVQARGRIYAFTLY